MFGTNITILYKRFLNWLTPLGQNPPGLLEAVQEAQRAWKQALHDFNYFTDPELVNYAALNIKTTERRYMALLKQAHQEGITAWPAELSQPVQDQAEEIPAPNRGDT